MAEELLQRPRGDPRFQGDRLDALLREVRELPTHVDPQVSTGVFASETVGEPTQKTFEFRLQLVNLLGIHASSSVKRGEESSFTNLPGPSKVNIAL